MCPRSCIRNMIFLALVPPFLAGCQDYKWQWSFDSTAQLERAEQQAQEQHKLVFIFYKWYLDSDANRMHGDVLADPRVSSLFSDTTNILIDKAAGPSYERHLTKYGVKAAPACILISPDGRYKVFKGYIPKDQFIEMVKDAKIQLLELQRRPAPSKVTP